MRKVFASLLILVSALLTGCMATLPQSGGTAYSPKEVNTELEVRFGTVHSVQEVSIERAGLLETAMGFVTGTVATSAITDNPLLRLAGGAAGGLLGNKIGASLEPADELTLRMDTGSLVVIVQARDASKSLRAGDRVRVVSNGKTSRVSFVESPQASVPAASVPAAQVPQASSNSPSTVQMAQAARKPRASSSTPRP